MSAAISREQVNRPRSQVAVTTVLATTAAIPFESRAGGMIFVPHGSSITTLDIYCAPWALGTSIADQPNVSAPVPTYYRLIDSLGNTMSLAVVADQCISLPPEAFAAGSIKLVGDAAGSIELSLKG